MRECANSPDSPDSDPELKAEINRLIFEGKIVPVKVTLALVRKAMEKAGGTVKYKILL